MISENFSLLNDWKALDRTNVRDVDVAFPVAMNLPHYVHTFWIVMSKLGGGKFVVEWGKCMVVHGKLEPNISLHFE